MTSMVASILFPPEFLAERRPLGDALSKIDKLLADLEHGRPTDPDFLRDLSMRMVGEIEQEGDLAIHWQRWLVRFVHGRFQVQGVEPKRLEWLARLLQRLLMVCEVGTLMKLGPIRIQEMSIAALLHDCGSVLLLGKGHLDREKVRAAIEHGWSDYLGPFRNESWMGIVLTSKELIDGSGYPNGLKGDQIPVEARIINLIASFQAIVQPRDYRINLMPSQALELLLRTDRHRYDTRVATFLLKAMTPFPAGCLVAVRDVGVGEVVRPHSSAPMRPEVAVVLDERMRPIPNPRRVDIRAMPVLNVHKAFCMGELDEDVWRLFDPPSPLSVRASAPPPKPVEPAEGYEVEDRVIPARPEAVSTRSAALPVAPVEVQAEALAGTLLGGALAASTKERPSAHPEPTPPSTPALTSVDALPAQPVIAPPVPPQPEPAIPAPTRSEPTQSEPATPEPATPSPTPMAPTIPVTPAPQPPGQRSLRFAEQMAQHEARQAELHRQAEPVAPPPPHYVTPPISDIVQPAPLFAANPNQVEETVLSTGGDDLFAEMGGRELREGLDPADHPFFRLLPEEIMAEVPFDRLPVIQMRRGEMLLRRGEVADSMLLLLSGQVEMIDTDGHGQPVVISHRSGGEVVGELGLLDGTRMVDVMAIHDGWYIPLSAKLVRKLMDEAPQVGSTLRALHRLHGAV